MNDLCVRLVDPDEYAAAWEAVADRTGASPFVRRGWVRPWQEAFGRTHLVLLAAFRGDLMVGAMPLHHHDGVLSSPTNWHTPEYAVIAEDPGVEAALIEALVVRNGRRVELGFVHDDLLQKVVEQAASRGQRVIARTLERGPYIDLHQSWDEYLDRRDRHMRAEIRRRRRRLEELGDVTLAVLEQPTFADLEDFFQVEASGWKAGNGTAISTEPPTRRFYEDVAAWAGSRGWLRLALLRLDKQPVAGDFCIEFGGAHYLLKTGFEVDLRRYGPGKLLRHEMVARAFREGLDRYEFLGVDDAWKMEWTDTVRPVSRVQTFGPSVTGRIDHLAYYYGRPAAKALVGAGRRWLG